MAFIGNIKGFLFKLFWINRLDDLARDTDKFVLKGFRWFARMAMAVYVILLPQLIIQTLLAPSVDGLIAIMMCALFFPLGFRFVAFVQIKLHSL